MHAPQPHQRALPMYGQSEPPAESRPIRVRKNVRAISKETYNVLGDTGMLGAAGTKVIRSLKAYMNRYQHAPTPAELTRWMFQAGVIKRDSVNLVAPRLTEMARGKVVRAKDGGTMRVGGREIELLPVRRCHVTGNDAHPVQPRQKGSVEPR